MWFFGISSFFLVVAKKCGGACGFWHRRTRLIFEVDGGVEVWDFVIIYGRVDHFTVASVFEFTHFCDVTLEMKHCDNSTTMLGLP